MNKNAQALFSLVAEQMPSSHQKANLKALLQVLLSGSGNSRAEHSQSKSPAALSRFLNRSEWGLFGLVRKVRRFIERVLLEQNQGRCGPKPRLLVIVDLSCLEKERAFPELPIHYLNGKRGLHYVVLYLVLGQVKLPWGLWVWQGAGTTDYSSNRVGSETPGQPAPLDSPTLPGSGVGGRGVWGQGFLGRLGPTRATGAHRDA